MPMVDRLYPLGLALFGLQCICIPSTVSLLIVGFVLLGAAVSEFAGAVHFHEHYHLPRSNRGES